MNPAALLLFALSGASIVSGVGFAITVGEESGSVVLILGGVAAGIAALATVFTQGRDVAVPADSAEARSLSPSIPAVWPLALGLASLVVATGMATGSGLVWIGLAAAAVAGTGWFAQSWSAHPTWTDEQHERVSSRLVLPLAIPVGVTTLVLLLAFAFSRALLAVSVNGSVLLALVAALVILGAGVLVAFKGLSRSAVLGLLTAGAVTTAALGVGGAVAGEREFHQKGEGEHAAESSDAGHAEEGEEGGHAEEPEAGAGGAASGGAVKPEGAGVPEEGEPEASTPRSVKLSADKLAFDKEAFTLPADQPTVIEFTNKESQPHNVAIKTAGGNTIFRPEGGGIITGPGKDVDYDVPPLKEGEYTFFCEVHPAQMQGELTVA
jgi:plastocyanin